MMVLQSGKGIVLPCVVTVGMHFKKILLISFLSSQIFFGGGGFVTSFGLHFGYVFWIPDFKTIVLAVSTPYTTEMAGVGREAEGKRAINPIKGLPKMWRFRLWKPMIKYMEMTMTYKLLLPWG